MTSTEPPVDPVDPSTPDDDHDDDQDHDDELDDEGKGRLRGGRVSDDDAGDTGSSSSDTGSSE